MLGVGFDDDHVAAVLSTLGDSFTHSELKKIGLPVYGAFLNGDSIYETKFGSGGIILMGNESNGISKELEPLVSRKITIPRFGQAESLNVATATAILLSEFKRGN